MTNATSSFSSKIVFETRDFERSHGKKPRLSQDSCGWAFRVYEWDNGAEIIWTRGRTAREIKAEIASHVKAPAGMTVVAYFQP